ncbi:unnamed protein product [Linum tenue]|uniref:Uncharacterized protein n=2 Tax=Linum tenue TaxID=586396 RepID=A0AAV0NCJ9_9ROSI|nr:unnamed protein product [Linum tenue]
MVQLVGEHGVKSWSQIAGKLDGRIGKQCRERWHNHLKPDIKTDAWSEEEDVILIQAHKKMGNKWAKIAELLPGRTENNIKNHWNAAKRRQPISTRRNYRSAEPSASAAALKDYIHAVTSPSSPSLTETIQSPAPSNWVANSNFVIGSPSEAATGPPASGAMYDLHEASEQPFHFDADSDGGFEGGGFGSAVEIPEFSFSDFSNTNLFGMSIDSYNGEVDGPAMGMVGNGGEEAEGLGLLDILDGKC